MWLCSLVADIAAIVFAVKPEATETTSDVKKAYFAWVSMSIALNTGLTAIIAGKLLWFRREFRSILDKEHLYTYSNIASIIVESGAFFAIVAVFDLAFEAAQTSVASAGFTIVSPIIGIAPVSNMIFHKFGILSSNFPELSLWPEVGLSIA